MTSLQADIFVLLCWVVGLCLIAGFALLCKSFRRDNEDEDEDNNKQEKG